jgi:hypothetical protein
MIRKLLQISYDFFSHPVMRKIRNQKILKNSINSIAVLFSSIYFSVFLWLDVLGYRYNLYSDDNTWIVLVAVPLGLTLPRVYIFRKCKRELLNRNLRNNFSPENKHIIIFISIYSLFFLFLFTSIYIIDNYKSIYKL